MFQIHLRLDDVQQARKLYNTVTFKLGEWHHFGWSYYNEVSYGYKDGCQHQKISSWSDDPNTPAINPGVFFGSESDMDIDVQFDEVYFWEVRKPASVFSVLYARGF